MLSLSPEPPSQSIRTRPRDCFFNNLCVWGWYTACANPGLCSFLLLKVWSEDQQHQHQPYYKCRFSGSTPDCLDLIRVQGSTVIPTLDTTLILQAPPLHHSPFTSWFCSAVRLMLLMSSHTRSSSSQTILWVHIFHGQQTPSNMLEAHMIWPDTESHLNFSILQPHLPPGSSLNTHTLSCPPAFALEAPLPGEDSAQTCLWTFFHVLHIFTQRSSQQGLYWTR